MGANVIAIDVDAKKLEAAMLEGAVATVDASDENPIEVVHEVTKGGAHVSVDALGIKTTCVNSIRSLRARGRHWPSWLVNHHRPTVRPAM